jgi:2-polyprenyl-3-methyl-5-hydroxy-6-metoxy-1,4-benzoquinol methylase
VPEVIATFDYAAFATEAVDTCALCGAADAVPIIQGDRSGFPATAVMCRRCSLIWLNPRMPADQYARFYAEGTYREIVAELRGKPQDFERLKKSQEEYAAAVINIIEQLGAPPSFSTLLDVGGSTGVVASAIAKRFGWRATVVDPATSELEYAASLGCETEYGIAESWEQADRTWDVVGLFQTVDHLLSPEAVLRKLRSCLAPSGWLIVDIVEIRAMLKAVNTPSDAIKIDHPYSWSVPTMAAMLAKVGLHVAAWASTQPLWKTLFVCRATQPRPWAVPAWDAPDEIARLIKAGGAN